MNINKRALKALKLSSFTGERLVSLFEGLLKEMQPDIGEIEFTIGFDKDDSALEGELLPEITFRLKEKN